MRTVSKLNYDIQIDASDIFIITSACSWLSSFKPGRVILLGAICSKHKRRSRGIFVRVYTERHIYSAQI